MQTNSTHQQFAALPDAAVERLFARLAAMYGDGAMKRMWGQQDPDAVKAIWARSLGRVELTDIASGLQALEDAGSTFPPALGEFIAACRRKPAVVPAEHRPLLPLPDRTPEEIAAGHAMAKRIASAVRPDEKRDPAAWAYRVIARYRSGDRVVAHASYKCALEALHNLGRSVPA
jgi:hypothetical protein